MNIAAKFILDCIFDNKSTFQYIFIGFQLSWFPILRFIWVMIIFHGMRMKAIKLLCQMFIRILL